MLYWVEYDIQKKYRYAWKDISFIGYDRSVCSQCNRQIAIPQYKNETPHLLIEGSGVSPDYLQFCGAGRQLFLVSEKALDILEINRITGYDDYHLVTCEVSLKGRKVTQLPEYYSLNISGKIDLNFAAMHLKKKRLCSQCGQFEWNRMRLNPQKLNQSTWDGSDICLIASTPGFRVCTERFKEIIKKHKLTGFAFSTEEGQGDGLREPF